MRLTQEKILKKKCLFKINYHYELFYALNVLTDNDSRIHPQWKERTLASLPESFFEKFRGIGANPFLWVLITDTFDNHLDTLTFKDFLGELKKIPTETFKFRMLEGLFHDESIVRDLIEGKITLFETLSKVDKSKLEWLSFVGLYPYNSKHTITVALEKLLEDAHTFKKVVLQIVEIFWDYAFKELWDGIEDQLQRSVGEKSRLFESCTLSEFASLNMLRIEVNSPKSVIKAIRGNYQMSFNSIKNCVFIPSLFNDNRFWSAYEDLDNYITAYFPYFEPSITTELQHKGLQIENKEPQLDSALIFKALGDTTRYGIVSILAKSSKSSAELAQILSLSKPTISHHVHVLKEAGLIRDEHLKGAIYLNLRKDTLENLSNLVIHKLYHSNSTIEIHKTRRK
jgi:ArsR family transcriptional regulator